MLPPLPLQDARAMVQPRRLAKHYVECTTPHPPPDSIFGVVHPCVSARRASPCHDEVRGALGEGGTDIPTHLHSREVVQADDLHGFSAGNVLVQRVAQGVRRIGADDQRPGLKNGAGERITKKKKSGSATARQ